MSQGSVSNRREFGRRESNVKAYAALRGQILLPCVIENISDGGALLRFTGGAAPIQSFRLMIESTEFNILCEIRHTARRRVGVRFVRLADGIALNRHLLRSITQPQAATTLIVCPVRIMRGGSVPSVRQLREAVLGSHRPAVAEPHLWDDSRADAAIARSMPVVAAAAVASAAAQARMSAA